MCECFLFIVSVRLSATTGDGEKLRLGELRPIHLNTPGSGAEPDMDRLQDCLLAGAEVDQEISGS